MGWAAVFYPSPDPDHSFLWVGYTEFADDDDDDDEGMEGKGREIEVSFQIFSTLEILES